MRTPEKTHISEYLSAKVSFLDQECVANGKTGLLYCRQCGERILGANVTLLVHNPALPEDKSLADVVVTGIPYCPHCEEMPAAEGSLYC